MLHLLVQNRSCVRPDSLLRAIYIYRTVFTAKRIFHITRNPEGTFLEFRHCQACVNSDDPVKFTDPSGDLSSFRIQKSVPKRLKHPCSPVCRRTAPDSDNEFSSSFFHCIPNHLSYAKTCVIPRIQTVRMNKRDSGRLRHLHPNRLSIRQYPVFCCYMLPVRPCHTDFTVFSTQSFDHAFRCSLSSVRYRFYDNIRPAYLSDSGLCRRSRLYGTNAPFHRINRCYNFHIIPPAKESMHPRHSGSMLPSFHL